METPAVFRVSADLIGDAWHASLPMLANALSEPQLSSLHMYFAGHGSLALEYQLPAVGMQHDFSAAFHLSFGWTRAVAARDPMLELHDYRRCSGFTAIQQDDVAP
ncbi:MAG: hypothetical protein ACRD2A_22205 [Vicinamibacterales bacterium]